MIRPPEVLVDEGIGALGALIIRAAERTNARVCDVSRLLVGDGSRIPSSAAAVLVGRVMASRQPSEDIIERIRSCYPHLSIWVCGRPEDGIATRVVRYSKAGAGMVFEIGTPSDLQALARSINDRVHVPAPSALIWKAASISDGDARSLTIDCLLESFRRRQLSEVEQRFGHDHKTLNTILQRANVVTVGRLLRAGRLAHDVELRRTGLYTREQVARLLGYASSKRLAEAWRNAARCGLVHHRELAIFRS